MKLKKFSFIALIFGALLITAGLSINLFCDVGPLNPVTLWGITLVASALFCLLFSGTVKAHCNVKSTLSSLSISASAAMGFYCYFTWYAMAAFGERHLHPVAYPLSIGAGFVSLFVFVTALVLYVFFRKGKWTFKGVIIDALTFFIYFTPFLSSFAYIGEI